MPFTIKDTKNKNKSVTKSIYLSEKTIAEVDKIAQANNTSFSNVIASMIEYCLDELDEV